MTNQPDAYTLAAQAAADRARAEALQRGGAQPGPGLQSPMRRLSKNPLTRWVLSAVLLAAGTALAVDYLNTGLKARLQNVLRIPGFNGGKTVAEDAAQVSAKPAAEIEENIVKPEGDKVRMAAQESTAKSYLDTEIHLSERKLIVAGTNTLFHRIGTQSKIGYVIDGSPAESISSILQGNDIQATTAETLKSGQIAVPYVYYRKDSNPTSTAIANAPPAIIPIASPTDPNHAALIVIEVTDGQDEVGYISQDDFKRLSPIPKNMEVEQYEDIGTFGLGDREVAISHGNMLSYQPDTGQWKESFWKNCNPWSGHLPTTTGEKVFACDSDGSSFKQGRFLVHAVLSKEAPPSS